MNTDIELLNEFEKSDIYADYISPLLDLKKEMPRSQVPETMYALLAELAEETGEKDLRKVLQLDLVEVLCSRVSDHEVILILQSSLGGKFYRDHLKHMFRVMLLTHKIGHKLGLPRNSLLACTLAGLFHDIAYPLEKADETMRIISQSLMRAYPYLGIKSPSLKLPPCPDEIDKVLNICKVTKVSDLGKENSHAILSALAFLNFWQPKSLDKDKNLREVVRSVVYAIATHDSDIKRKLKYSRDPVSTILILADELQDWGRPVGWDEARWEPTPNIKPFQVTKKGIRAGFDYSKSPKHHEKTETAVFSPLLQIESKQKNMSKIVLNGGFPKLLLTYKLPAYYVLRKDLILSYVKQVQSYEKAVIEKALGVTDLESFVMSGPMTRDWPVSPERLLELARFAHWLFDVFYEAVAKSRVPLHLHYNLFTGEYVLYSGIEMPSTIVATKNRKGKVEWDYILRELTKPLTSAPLRPCSLGVRLGLFFDIIARYDIPFREAERQLQSIKPSQPAENFVALLQLLPRVYLEASEVWRLWRKPGAKEPEWSETVFDDVMILRRAYRPQYRFFLLER